MENKALAEIKDMFDDLGIDMKLHTNLPEPNMDLIPKRLPRELQEELDRRRDENRRLEMQIHDERTANASTA